MYISHGILMYLLGLSEKGEECELGILKKEMKSHGINQRGWRLFVDYGDRLFTPILRQGEPKRPLKGMALEAIQWIRVLQACEMDVPPPLNLSKSVARWPLPDTTTGDIPPLFLRAIWKAAICMEYQEQDVQTFLDEDVSFVATWYFSQTGKKKLSDGQLKAGWETIWKIYEEDLRTPQNAERASWESWVNQVEHDGYIFDVLSSASALYLEGKTMGHCIADYTHGCRLGKHRVYAVTEKRTRGRVATITVELSDTGIWELDEIHGPENDDVSDRLLHSADAVCRSLNDLYRMSGWVRASMRKQMKSSSA